MEKIKAAVILSLHGCRWMYYQASQQLTWQTWKLSSNPQRLTSVYGAALIRGRPAQRDVPPAFLSEALLGRLQLTLTGPRIKFPARRLAGRAQREDKSKKKEAGNKRWGGDSGGGWRRRTLNPPLCERRGGTSGGRLTFLTPLSFLKGD